MYFEVLLIGVIIYFLLDFSGRLSTNRFIEDNQTYFRKLKEKDYDFYCYAKYGSGIDLDKLFSKRLRNGFIVIILLLFLFITKLSYVNVIFSLLAGYLMFKLDYINKKNYYKKHLHDIDLLLPYYLKSLEILIQHYTVPVAMGKSVEEAPTIFKDGLTRLVEKIDAGDASIEPYMEFAREYPVRDSMRMMRLLYRLSLGRQDRKQEQLLTFSKTISNFTRKSRETKYKERLEKMENKTMYMLVSTGAGVMLLLVLSILMMFNV